MLCYVKNVIKLWRNSQTFKENKTVNVLKLHFFVISWKLKEKIIESWMCCPSNLPEFSVKEIKQVLFGCFFVETS